ncbi:NAC domain-containing protein 2-like [Salvia splendens]|uniref:NAC domain-containing protein 2-like n=1 Tax=Salvia splendens TaxID=180675 RepID=UPI001C25A340|nr:NAC domain-containing protein 2-like [Salvia splendens]
MQAYHHHPPSLRRHNSHVNCAAAGDKASGVGIMGEFNPTDAEIIREYLMKKINNEAFHTDMISPVHFYAFTPDYLSDIMHSRKVIGSCRQFVYFTGKRRDSVRTDWMMREFTAPENRARMKDWVVCKMYRNEIRISRKRNHDGEANNNPAYTEAIRPVDDSSTPKF